MNAVLKGFFVYGYNYRNTCTLSDLKELIYLQKLFICTDSQDFPLEMHVADLEKMRALTKLIIAWRVSGGLREMGKVDKWPNFLRSSESWISGASRSIDDENDEKKWTYVEMVRLKYLGKMEMEWRQLQGLFPRFKYLEKVSCPYLTLFPCDAKGVWINPQ
ncbi:uncharacterized protein LOC131013095 [Salvia miltiorrhiza]|uniref:uncharacterized protein LOC131013095 n=1 Tax=Salvia miltiorrhiza TaxID=226208 RepID=UPI0025AC2827|nr:uncharacterized protein LOC131013095 [Salvia miltiorrhiza]